MFKFVSVSCLLAVSLAQFVDPDTAKILKEQRFNAGDGRFGSAYAQEDGTVYREETTADGERVGQYSYIDNDGKTITVRYTAGRDGFRILEGDHVPTGATGLTAAAFKPANAAPAPAPLRQQPVQQVAQPLDYDYYEETPSIQADPNANPFINPHDPTHRNFQFNVNGAQFQPQGGNRFAQPQQSAVPACANCAGVNPFINPFDASHRNPQAFVQQQPQQQQRFVQPRQQQFQQQPQQFQQTFAPATPAPTRNFFPPGQLQLNRFETGFNFDFTSQ